MASNHIAMASNLHCMPPMALKQQFGEEEGKGRLGLLFVYVFGFYLFSVFLTGTPDPV